MTALQKTLGIAGVIILALVASHWFAYNRGKDDLRLELLSSPIKTDTTRLPDVKVEAPPETLQGPSKPVQGAGKPPRPPLPPGIAALDGTIPCTQVVNSLLDSIAVLNQPQRTVEPLRDSLGGQHDITYYPAEKRFSEAFRPVRIEQPFLVEREKYVPMGGKDWVVGPDFLAKDGGGFGASLGRKPLVLHWMTFPQDKTSAFGASLLFEF